MLTARLKAQLGLIAASAVFLGSLTIIVSGAIEPPGPGQSMGVHVSHVGPVVLGNVSK